MPHIPSKPVFPKKEEPPINFGTQAPMAPISPAATGELLKFIEAGPEQFSSEPVGMKAKNRNKINGLGKISVKTDVNPVSIASRLFS